MKRTIQLIIVYCLLTICSSVSLFIKSGRSVPSVPRCTAGRCIASRRRASVSVVPARAIRPRLGMGENKMRKNESEGGYPAYRGGYSFVIRKHFASLAFFHHSG